MKIVNENVSSSSAGIPSDPTLLFLFNSWLYFSATWGNSTAILGVIQALGGSLNFGVCLFFQIFRISISGGKWKAWRLFTYSETWFQWSLFSYQVFNLNNIRVLVWSLNFEFLEIFQPITSITVKITLQNKKKLYVNCQTNPITNFYQHIICNFCILLNVHTTQNCKIGESGAGCSAHTDGCDGSTGIVFTVVETI